MQIITGVFDIVNGLSAFASFAGPAGTEIAAITGLIDRQYTKFEFWKNKEIQEHMLKRIVTEALSVQTDDDLRSLADGEMAIMNCNLVILQKLSEYPTLCPDVFVTK